MNKTSHYEVDDKAGSLIIPPDLTKPNSQGVFSENIELAIFVNKVDEIFYKLN